MRIHHFLHAHRKQCHALLACLLLAVLCTFVASCSKDDDDQDNREDTPQQEVETPQSLSIPTGYYVHDYFHEAVARNKWSLLLELGAIPSGEFQEYASAYQVLPGNRWRVVEDYISTYSPSHMSPSDYMLYDTKSWTRGRQSFTVYFFFMFPTTETNTYTYDGQTVVFRSYDKDSATEYKREFSFSGGKLKEKDDTWSKVAD